MLSYKHGYHAGNEADVLKHICLIQAYKSLKRFDFNTSCKKYLSVINEFI